jgi:hypothetical protein
MAVVLPTTAMDGPIPSTLMLAKNVVFAPRLRGTEERALCPLRDQAYKGESDVLVSISSTNTSRLVSILSAAITRQAALNHLSRSLAPKVLFSAKAEAL